MENNQEMLEKLDSKYIEGCIEAILFAAGHPMPYSKLAEVLSLTENQVKKKVKAFSEKYNADDKKGIMLLCFDDRCQLCTKERFLPYIKEALGLKKGGNLSNSSLEVLAIIAYNTNIRPVTRAYIDAVRKVDSAYIVASLCEKELIEPCGRLDAPGRPHVYRVTSKFMRVFGIETLEQLPYVELPVSQPEGVAIPMEIDMPEGEGQSADNSNDDNAQPIDAQRIEQLPIDDSDDEGDKPPHEE